MLLRNLSPNKLDSILALNRNYPNIVFGGSISLCALGIIDRTIKDIDIVINSSGNSIFTLRTSNSSNSFVDIEDKTLNGFDASIMKQLNPNNYYFRHYSGLFNGENICLFDVNNSIEYYNYELSIGISIKIQHPDIIMAAKSEYHNRYSIEKHRLDIELYRNWTSQLLPYQTLNRNNQYNDDIWRLQIR